MRPNKNSTNQSTKSAYDRINSSILLSRLEYHSSLNSCCQLSDSGRLAHSRIPMLRNQRSFGLYPSIFYELSLEPFGTCGIRQPTLIYAVSDTNVNFRHQHHNHSDSVVMFIGWMAGILVDVNPEIPTKLSVTYAIRILEWWGQQAHLKPDYTWISKPDDKGVAMVVFFVCFWLFKVIVSLMHPNKNSTN